MKVDKAGSTTGCQLRGSLIGIFAVIALVGYAQELRMPLWKGVPAGSENWASKEGQIDTEKDGRIIRNVVEPDLLAFLPEKEKANGTAIIIAPGGAFRILAYDKEGTWVAKWFQEHGVAAFVLKYRTQNFPPRPPGQPRPANNNSNKTEVQTFAESLAQNKELTAVSVLADQDGIQAMKIVRERANEFGISADKIGFIGFSAGGLVALHAGIHADEKIRPNFIGLIYTSTNEFSAPENAPPMFALVANDDMVVGNGSLIEYQAWKAQNLPAELHIYERGGHGFGMSKQNLPVDFWIDRFGDWLSSLGYLPK